MFNDHENQLPLTILKSELKGGKVEVNGSTSSQFISALMLIGPYLKGGLEIQIVEKAISWPYIEMTARVMQHYGVQVELESSCIRVPEGIYNRNEINIESDWSAASFWYEIAALSRECKIKLKGLTKESWQGDSIIAKLSGSFGVTTEYFDDGVLLSKTPGNKITEYFNHDMSGCPDLGLPLAALCGGLNITADLENLTNFRLKESDRAVAMQRGLYDLNVKTDFCGGSKFKIYTGTGISCTERVIKTYNDHRIAMAFAPLAMKTKKIILDNPEVVTKSYPGYFNDLKSAGFQVDFQND